jgi:DNA-directed RNA polymerase subunit omega
MIRKYPDEAIIEKAGGRFKLASLLQKRYKEMLFGSRPLVTIETSDILDVLVEEIMQGKMQLIPESEAIAAAHAALLYEPAPDSEREAEKVAEELARAGAAGPERLTKEKKQEKEEKKEKEKEDEES